MKREIVNMCMAKDKKKKKSEKEEVFERERDRERQRETEREREDFVQKMYVSVAHIVCYRCHSTLCAISTYMYTYKIRCKNAANLLFKGGLIIVHKMQ